MRRALRLAAKGEGATAPNPPVGAVIVREGVVLGEGWHHAAGRPHAEVEAVRNASCDVRGATMYVTLEPCCTHGRTPPCTELITSVGIARVVVGTDDPNPAHSGRGLEVLADAGVSVEVGVLREQAQRLIAGFVSLMLRGRPHLTLKLGCTLDGKIADKSGSSQWITGSKARAEVQRMRRACDAVMVGVGTALADDPSLRCRLRGAPVGRRVIVDARGLLPLGAQVLSDGNAEETVVVTGPQSDTAWREAVEQTGAECWVLPLVERGCFDGNVLMRRMGEAGWTRVLCEGGAGLAGRLMDDGVVDELVVFAAPCVLGGDGLSAVGGNGTLLEGIRRGRFDEVKRLGDDVMLRMVW